MRAFVLSGGANYGAQQVGALEVLLEQGLQPDMVVGVSAGALNAAWLAQHPTLEGVTELARIWCEDAAASIPAVGPLTALLRLIGGKDSLLSNDSLLQFLRRWPFAESAFGEFIRPRLYTVAADYQAGTLRIFGDDPHDRLIDGLMTSTAMPPFYPPWEVDGIPYLDGGVISHLPLQVALDRGADEIFALHNGHGFMLGPAPTPRTVLSVGAQALALLVNRQAQLEIEAVQRNPAVRLHLIELYADDDPGLWNFACAAGLIAAGRRLTKDYLKNLGETGARPEYSDRSLASDYA
ncbi:MAG TPA: patatin-like phospholipase family protein [Anaerolineae bacterium]|nr:patatin-like phospholipase family protein [Anaerolineae bacterium]